MLHICFQCGTYKGEEFRKRKATITSKRPGESRDASNNSKGCGKSDDEDTGLHDRSGCFGACSLIEDFNDWKARRGAKSVVDVSDAEQNRE